MGLFDKILKRQPGGNNGSTGLDTEFQDLRDQIPDTQQVLRESDNVLERARRIAPPIRTGGCGCWGR